ncbi:MAG: winged helix-turn-helix domain-containing protein [Candidatus Bathyarchaeia archaeon]
MKLSKLELYIEILKVISQQRLMNLAMLQNKTKINLDYLQERVAFLVAQGLVEQRSTGNQVLYKNTPRGTAILRYFKTHESQETRDEWVSA